MRPKRRLRTRASAPSNHTSAIEVGDRALNSHRRPVLHGALGNAKLKEGYEEPVRLLRRATRLLDEADLCGANEALKEAAKALAQRGGGRAGSPDLPNPEERR